jgi:hypothetical protein
VGLSGGRRYGSLSSRLDMSRRIRLEPFKFFWRSDGE